jgi:hypothetical protein
VPGWEGLGKILMGLGGFLFALGIILAFFGRVLHLGRLPGDILIQRENFTFYFPLASGLVLSLILTLILNMIRRWR